MSYADNTLKLDANGRPIPQAYNPVLDDFEEVTSYGKQLIVGTLQQPWREDFPGTGLNTNWQVVQTGSGHTISVANSVLSIATGTTANTETIIRSTKKFTIPFRVWFIAYLSQRIANQEFYLEVVNEAGDMVAQWLLDGTSATNGKHNVANAGTYGGAISMTTLSSASYTIFEIELFPDETYFVSRYADSTSSKSYVGCRTRLIPDLTQEYYIQIRAKNLSTAPASSTTLYIDAVVVQDISELTAEITGGRGGGGASQSISVYAPAGVSAYMRNRRTVYTDSTTALAASATYTGSTRDLGTDGNNYPAFAIARAYADQPGTLYIEQSRDGTIWRSAVGDSIALAAGETRTLTVRLLARYWRVKYVNGATAQGSFELISSTSEV
ncbi:hypothetical protein SAMN02745885_01663 [Carboxydocella sporoproducens DSM 16521]|uniref:Uncharacterized protein n=2 Tax=Carboxydocella TaxID=178898 RepID=A0A1T4QFX5_9FIRM|nr:MULTISPECIES: hypothetical protein [Carboxydocella]AVX21588.1 hypothetical protein CFE_2445 [Carboxydocella thermautotrophica]SKA02690.1 hypothetical protein SAMN02745885_01663 [Carboxydocella sporoproducens DSM 16521]